jgi:putative membrane protein
MWFMHDGVGWWMMFGGFWMIVFWGAVIALIVWGIMKLAGRGESKTQTHGRPDPLDIARERYARGEISREEFEQIKKDLT